MVQGDLQWRIKLKNTSTVRYVLLSVLGAAAALFIHGAQAADSGGRVHVTYPSKAHAKSAVHKRARAVRRAKTSSDGPLALKSAAALVVDQNDGQTIYAKNTQVRVPIASITKLMTAMVVLDAALPLDEVITIDHADFDQIKHTGSRLAAGFSLPRGEMLRLALMASENRAAASLGRNYPGGVEAFVAAMNQKAAELGMWNTHFVEPTGLSSQNRSTAEDLAKMVNAAYQYPLIREFTTTAQREVETETGRSLQFRNSNGLVRDRNSSWSIGLSKTGYISEAGRCLVMQANIAARSVIIVLLDSLGKNTRLGDANRIKKWLETRMVFRRPDIG